MYGLIGGHGRKGLNHTQKPYAGNLAHMNQNVNTVRIIGIVWSLRVTSVMVGTPDGGTMNSNC